ncbi:hypothetical protein [Nocardia sp. NBC_01327]|uniref:hypothetical protein n=1 Tax=Nocardia sp. NBC_01327 TaxID=2903593 RepID=UPI002E141DC6|nr:hypothetical protein OG326_34320 [Nocardia sp. NBC_01327]
MAEVVYPVTSDMTPAYLDLEADVLRKIAAIAWYEGSDPRLRLSEAIRAVAISERGTFSLKELASETHSWPRAAVEPPPCLAFLALTVLAAEDMGNAAESLAPRAYYARLARLLSLSDDDAALRNQYRMHAEFFWDCVNVWLVNLGGERGLPTAYSLSYRHVGLPMSQALVREGDRQKFPGMFAQFGLNPGARLAPEDLIPYLNTWLASESGASNLRRLWQRPGSHDKIAAIAAIELSNWNGLSQDSTSTSVPRRALLVATVRTGFLGSSLDLFLGLRPLGNVMDGQMEVRGASGDWVPLRFSRGTAGIWRTAYTETIDFGSVLDGLVRIRHHGDGDSDGSGYKRLPKAVVPFIYDELELAYVQSERLQLGADAIVLVRQGTGRASTSAVVEVEKTLNECARPGFSKHQIMAGLPPGWTLFAGVQLFRAPVTQTRIDELVPLARNQLTIAGGLRIPSRVRKWSTFEPPEVRATVQSETQLRVTLSKSLQTECIQDWSSDTGTLAADLNDLALPDGDYEVALYTGSKKTPTQQASLRLRSSYTVDPARSSAPRLRFSLATPMGVLTASEKAPEDAFVDGLVTHQGESGVTATVRATAEIFWSNPPKVAERPTVRIGTPDPKSCVVTGAHFIQLPPALGGRAPRWIQGVCTSCGMVTRYPGWLPRWGGTKSHDEMAPPQMTISNLVPVADEPVNWDAAQDVLMHMGGGPFASLESLAIQLEGSALFVINFARSLEALGHIAIERDDLGRPLRWQMSPACLAQTANGSYRLTGLWPADARESLVGSFANHIVTVRSEHGPTETFLVGIDEASAERVARHNAAQVAHDAGASLLAALPRLSAVSECLPRSAMPGFDAAARFDLDSANWMPTDDPSRSGAYRLRRGFETLYIYRSTTDIEKGSTAITRPNLAKHLAAAEIGRTFVLYNEPSQSLLSPNGCELPGLYARATVALAGCLPETKRITIGNNKRNCLSYASVDRHCADLIVTLLTT